MSCWPFSGATGASAFVYTLRLRGSVRADPAMLGDDLFDPVLSWFWFGMLLKRASADAVCPPERVC